MSFAVRTDAVGRVVGRQTVDVTFRMTSAYAAVLGAEQACYLDDGVAGGPVAPPAFTVVLEWPLLLRQPYIGDVGASEARYFDVLLHAFQDTHIDRLVRPGDRLETVATLIEVRPTAAGALAVCRVETRSVRDDAPVATSYIGSLFRGCPVEGGAASVAAVPALPAAGPGDAAAASEAIAIPRALPFLYTECSGHWNPIHTERAFARAAGYPDIVVHGTCTWALACQRLIDRYADGAPRRLRRYGARFSNVLTPDQTVAVRHARAAQDGGAVHFSVSDDRGRDVLTRGIAAFGAAAPDANDDNPRRHGP